MTTLLTDDQHVDVAADVVVATRIRTEHERVANACLSLKDRAELRDQTDRSRVEVAERRIHRIRGIHVPHSQRTDAPTLDESLPEELLKGELYGPRAPMDAPNEVACMELLARRTRQQREQAGLGPRTLDIGHDRMIHSYRLLIRTYAHYDSRLHHFGLGARHHGKAIVLFLADRDIRIVDADGELLRELVLDPTRDYQRQSA